MYRAGLIRVPLCSVDSENVLQWFVMRDLKRPNARKLAYEQLEEWGLTVFTPKVKKLVVRRGSRELREVPYIPSLLFVRDSREHLDDIVGLIPTLQYQWYRDKWRVPMSVPDADMERFIRVVTASSSPVYYLPSEITPQMYNRRIQIVGGPLDGQEGTLITTRGSKVKRLLVELPGLLAVSVEVSCEYIKMMSD